MTKIKQGIVIFDIDNCIADDSWRLKRIQENAYQSKDEMFEHYHKGMEHDIAHNIELLLKEYEENSIVFVTARPEKYKEQTEDWINRIVTSYGRSDFCYRLIMRPEFDTSHSPVLKPALIMSNVVQPQFIKKIYDDRDDVLEAYRKMFSGQDVEIIKLCIEERNMKGEFTLKDGILHVEKQKEDSVKFVPEILEGMAKTFRERNKVYGSNYKMVAPMMEILFPEGVPKEVIFSDQFHLFELILVKLSRFAISGLKHQDSIHDTAVYAAMIEAIIKGENHA